MTTEEDPFAAHVRDVLFPMLEQSSFYLGITPTGKPDPKFCVELGAAIMFDKPLLVVAMKGTTVPPGLRRVAHAVVEDIDMDSETDKDRLARFVADFAEGRRAD